jgi:cholesterol transport system auxiliary component
LLTLTPAEVRPASSPRTAGQGEAITVAVPAVPQALRTNRIPVYVNETTIQYLPEAVWVEQPGALFARLLGETIAARTGRVVLDPSQYSHDPGTRLTGTLVKFGLDPAAMQVVIVYDAAIARGPTGVITNRFEARVAVAEATPAAVAPALNQAANQLAGEVAAWVGN